MKEKVFFYQVEDGKVVAFQVGTDIPNDPSSTRSALDKWVSEDPNTRQVISQETPVETETGQYVLENGKLRDATRQEAQVTADAVDQGKETAWDARRTLVLSIQNKLKLSDEEMAVLLPGFPEWSKPMGGKK